MIRHHTTTQLCEILQKQSPADGFLEAAPRDAVWGKTHRMCRRPSRRKAKAGWRVTSEKRGTGKQTSLCYFNESGGFIGFYDGISPFFSHSSPEIWVPHKDDLDRRVLGGLSCVCTSEDPVTQHVYIYICVCVLCSKSRLGPSESDDPHLNSVSPLWHHICRPGNSMLFTGRGIRVCHQFRGSFWRGTKYWWVTGSRLVVTELQCLHAPPCMTHPASSSCIQNESKLHFEMEYIKKFLTCHS